MWSLSSLGTLQSGSSARIQRNGMAMSLNNDEDDVALIDSSGVECDRFGYSSAVAGEVIATGH